MSAVSWVITTNATGPETEGVHLPYVERTENWAKKVSEYRSKSLCEKGDALDDIFNP